MVTKKSDAKPAPKKTARKEVTPAPEPVEDKPQAKTSVSKLAKTQIVDLLAQKASVTKKQAAEVFDSFGNVVVDALRSGQTVGLPGIGTFSVTETKERQGVRPGTSERITIPAGKKVRFKVASTLKGSLSAE